MPHGGSRGGGWRLAGQGGGTRALALSVWRDVLRLPMGSPGKSHCSLRPPAVKFLFRRMQALNSTPRRRWVALRDHSHVGSRALVQHQGPTSASAAGTTGESVY